MGTIKLKINDFQQISVTLPDEEFLRAMQNDSSMLLNIAQQFVQDSVQSVEILQVDDGKLPEVEEGAAQNLEADREDKKLWTDENTRLLIELYKNHEQEFNDGIKKYVWNKIAKEWSEVAKGPITGVQCDTKWKGLLRQYKIIKKHNDVSGNDPKFWKFYSLMNDLLHKKPEITPVATCSSFNGLQVAEDLDTQSRCSTPTSVRNTPSPYSTKTKKKIENNLERRHREKMERQDRFLNILERLANNICGDNKPQNSNI